MTSDSGLAAIKKESISSAQPEEIIIKEDAKLVKSEFIQDMFQKFKLKERINYLVENLKGFSQSNGQTATGTIFQIILGKANNGTLCMWALLKDVYTNWTYLRYNEKDPRVSWECPWVTHVCEGSEDDHVLHKKYSDLEEVFTQDFY